MAGSHLLDGLGGAPAEQDARRESGYQFSETAARPLSFEQMLAKKLLERLVNETASLREDALNYATFGGNLVSKDYPVSAGPEPVIIFQPPFERADIATLTCQLTQCFS